MLRASRLLRQVLLGSRNSGPVSQGLPQGRGLASPRIRKKRGRIGLYPEPLEDRTLLSAATGPGPALVPASPEPLLDNLYQVLLQRPPAAAEVEHWTAALKTGLTPVQPTGQL
jgi:hypothetical protein